MVTSATPPAVMSPMAGLDWNGSRPEHTLSEPDWCQRTLPWASKDQTPPPEHCPASASPEPTNTWSVPSPAVSAAAGDELMGLPVDTGQPPTVLPLARS